MARVRDNRKSTDMDNKYLEDRGIKIGSRVRLHFAGGPHDMPMPWIVTDLGYKFSTVNYAYNPWIAVRAANGVERRFDRAEYYSPMLDESSAVASTGRSATSAKKVE